MGITTILFIPKRKVVWGYGTIGKALVSRMKNSRRKLLVLDQSDLITKEFACCDPSVYQETQNDMLFITFLKNKVARKPFESKDIQIIDLFGA